MFLNARFRLHVSNQINMFVTRTGGDAVRPSMQWFFLLDLSRAAARQLGFGLLQAQGS